MLNKILKQRNACLRNRNTAQQQLQYWTDNFIQYSVLVSQIRAKYIAQLSSELATWLSVLLPDLTDKIDVSYFQGWNKQKELANVLAENQEREKQLGYCAYGAHKFDVKFLYKKLSVEQSLSRGQQKMFLLALTLAQASLIEKIKNIAPIVLIDDIGAELDLRSRTLLSQVLKDLNCQLFITAIDKKALEPLIPNDKNYKMFHVKHGVISELGE